MSHSSKDLTITFLENVILDVLPQNVRATLFKKNTVFDSGAFCTCQISLRVYPRIYHNHIKQNIYMTEGSLKPNFRQYGQMKSRDGKSQRREEKKKEDQERESLRRKKIQVREKVGKSRNTVFPMICGSGGSKSRLAKATGAEPAGQMRDEQLHAVVARSTFPSQNV